MKNLEDYTFHDEMQGVETNARDCDDWQFKAWVRNLLVEAEYSPMEIDIPYDVNEEDRKSIVKLLIKFKVL